MEIKGNGQIKNINDTITKINQLFIINLKQQGISWLSWMSYEWSYIVFAFSRNEYKLKNHDYHKSECDLGGKLKLTNISVKSITNLSSKHYK